MFEFELQLRDTFIQAIIRELRKTAQPLLPKTCSDVEPIEITNDILAYPCINTTDDLWLNLHPLSNQISLQSTGATVQLEVQDTTTGSQLHEMSGNITLILAPQGRTEAERVQVGFDAANIDQHNVKVEITSGHPLADDEFFLAILNNQIQQLYQQGLFPPYTPLPHTNIPGLLQLDGAVLIVNDAGGDVTQTIRIIRSSLPSGYVLAIPIEVWLHLTSVGSTTPTFIHFRAECHTEALLQRQLEIRPAYFKMFMSQANVTLESIEYIAGGEECQQNPSGCHATEGIIEKFLTDIARKIGDREYPTYTLAEIEEYVAQVIAKNVRADGRFIELWGAPLTGLLRNARPRVLENSLAVGINQLEPLYAFSPEFLPEGREFALSILGSALLPTLEGYLNSPDAYADVAGKLTMDESYGAAVDILSVGGFDAAEGTVQKNTQLNVNGDTYFVSADSEITDHHSVVHIVPGLLDKAEVGTRVRVQFGMKREFKLARTTLRIGRLTPTLEEGGLRVTGDFDVRTKGVAGPLGDIDGKIKIRLGLHWTATGRVREVDASGTWIDVEQIPETVRELPAHSLLVIDRNPDVFSLMQSAEPHGESYLNVDPPVSDPAAVGSMVVLTWRMVGRVHTSEESGDPLSVRDIHFGQHLVPAGTRVSISGKRHTFTTESDSEISDGRASLTLDKAIADVFESGLDGGTDVTLTGEWNGRAKADGSDQEGDNLNLKDLIRIIPAGTLISVGGVNGAFKTTADAEISSDWSQLALSHPVVDKVASLLGEDAAGLWELLGHPVQGAPVRQLVHHQKLSVSQIGHADVDIEHKALLVFVSVLLFGVLGGPVAGAGAGIVVEQVDKFASQALDTLIDRRVQELVLPIPVELPAQEILIHSYMGNPVVVDPAHLFLAGSAVPTSSYPFVVESRALTNGPYEFRSGVVEWLEGANSAPKTDYTWLPGDNSVEFGLNTQHRYVLPGIYVATLVSLDRQWSIEIPTLHFASVQVLNSPPELIAPALLSGREGHEVELVAQFKDALQRDSHRALVCFGDGSLPIEAEVLEPNRQSMGVGEVKARHTYCDDGVFSADIILIDDYGGTDRTEVEVRIENVPPVVYAGDAVYFHPCTPLRLEGRFQDDGWCDRHRATWDFGDCSPVLPATVIETNDPPRTIGYATATHCYSGCGRFLAILTVTDDDGASASDTLVVEFSDLKNGDFEQGFHRQGLGAVGNHWKGYGLSLAGETEPAGEVFSCEECFVRSGHSSQAIAGRGLSYVGIHQSLGVNCGWEYQFVVDLMLSSPSASAWLGIDPEGGSTRDGATIQWSAVAGSLGWSRLSGRATATDRRMSIFIEMRDLGADTAVIDSVKMTPYPCPPRSHLQKLTGGPTEVVQRCASWSDLRSIPKLPPYIEQSGLLIRSISGDPLQIVTFGSPVGDTKLKIPDSDIGLVKEAGLEVLCPGAASRATVDVSSPPDALVTLICLDEDSRVVGSDASNAGGVTSLTVGVSGIRRLQLKAEHRGTVLQICIDQPTPSISGAKSHHSAKPCRKCE
jgi:hypothetical protein